MITRSGQSAATAAETVTTTSKSITLIKLNTLMKQTVQKSSYLPVTV